MEYLPEVFLWMSSVEYECDDGSFQVFYPVKVAQPDMASHCNKAASLRTSPQVRLLVLLALQLPMLSWHYERTLLKPLSCQERLVSDNHYGRTGKPLHSSDLSSINPVRHNQLLLLLLLLLSQRQRRVFWSLLTPLLRLHWISRCRKKS